MRVLTINNLIHRANFTHELTMDVGYRLKRGQKFWPLYFTLKDLLYTGA